MPGHCGFIHHERESQNSPDETLQKLLNGLRHHPSHFIASSFSDAMISAGLVLPQSDLGGAYENIQGVHVWIDGEAFDETGLMPTRELAAKLLAETPEVLNGAFSAVIYDPEAQRIRFITDAYGLKHLYVRITDSPAWSGELQSFFGMQDSPLLFSEQCLHEFLEHGYPLGTTTWFKDVELLEPGLLLTFDLKTRSWTRERYFKLENQNPDTAIPKWDDAVERLGLLFRNSVSRRISNSQTQDSKKTGLTLSGGLDSRAILAAFPSSNIPPETVTFGKPGCRDEELAQAACNVRHTPHTFIALGDEGWLEQREESVRLTQGQMNILHLHGLESLPQIEARMDICLHGFLGDALLGGSYLDGNGFPFFARYHHRGRRFILQALHYRGTGLIYRLPFMDVPLLEFALKLPRSWLRRSCIYRAMLLREFPEYYRMIPWEKTGLPVSTPAPVEFLIGFFRRVKNGVLRRLNLSSQGYADYARWLREGSARKFLVAHLEDPDALLYRFVPHEEVNHHLQRHFHGRDESEILGRYLTAEIWLQTLNKNGIVLKGKP